MTKNFEATLANIARGYASTATRLAKGFAPNNHLRESIRSWVEQKGQASFIIRTQARGPDARAREYGSGLHARRGPKTKIPIRPKNYPALIFPWEKAHPSIPRTKKGHVILYKVEHPGIEAANNGRGYIGPAIRETNKFIRERIKKEGAAAIKADLRASFRRK